MRGAGEAGGTSATGTEAEFDLVVLPVGDRLGAAASRGATKPADIARAVAEAAHHTWVLLWHPGLGEPNRERLRQITTLPGDVFHAGLSLGTADQELGLLDAVAPSWMFQVTPHLDRVATSWRLTVHACLIRGEAVRQLGGPSPAFRTLTGMGLEWGHRLLARGAFVRHVPGLLDCAPCADGTHAARATRVPLEDEARLVLWRYGRRWLRWALARAAGNGYASPLAIAHTLRALHGGPVPPKPAPFERQEPADAGLLDARVSVLVPTIDRYPYLERLLAQLGAQTVRPHEVVLVDQTPLERRLSGFEHRFPDLPLRVLTLERAGQCSARNVGLRALTGEVVLFLDDDGEVPPDLIARYLQALRRFGADAVCGGVDEVGAAPPGEAFTFVRASDVFPTGASMLRRAALARSGLFDLAFDRGSRADAELGMRLYKSGALTVLDPSIRVLHHRAPQGGLRVHGARVVTFSSSRTKLLHRHLPSATEVYLSRRHFTPRQQREAVVLRTAGTLAGRGGPLRRLAKVAVGLALLPSSLAQIKERQRQADRLLADACPIEFPDADDGDDRPAGDAP